jgi:hypothetical protein
MQTTKTAAFTEFISVEGPEDPLSFVQIPDMVGTDQNYYLKLWRSSRSSDVNQIFHHIIEDQRVVRAQAGFEQPRTDYVISENQLPVHSKKY